MTCLVSKWIFGWKSVGLPLLHSSVLWVQNWSVYEMQHAKKCNFYYIQYRLYFSSALSTTALLHTTSTINIHFGLKYLDGVFRYLRWSAYRRG